jgi:hypothetical protein
VNPTLAPALNPLPNLNLHLNHALLVMRRCPIAIERADLFPLTINEKGGATAPPHRINL